MLSTLPCAASSTALPRWATPRTPERHTHGPQVGQIAAELGQPLMPWQQMVADVALEVDPETGRLAYRQVVVTVPRQSGKTTLMLSVMTHRALAFGAPQRIVYTAQTRNDARQKWEDEHVPMLERSALAKAFRVRRLNGNEAILWRNGSIQKLAATLKKSGHGQTLDLAVADEAFAQVDDRLEQAFKPAMVTRPQPQLWIVSTAGTTDSHWLRSKVDMGRDSVLADRRYGVAYFEWSADEQADPDDPATWLSCMPALGHTITLDTIRSDHATMRPGEFARAYLNLWWAHAEEPVIDPAAWAKAEDRRSQVVDPVEFAVDMPPDRSTVAIAVYGRRADGLGHGELVDRISVASAVARTADVVRRAGRGSVALDPGGPAGSLIPALTDAGLEVVQLTVREHVQAAGDLHDEVVAGRFRHLGQPELSAAVSGAKRRPLGDAWAWSRKDSSCDISPLVAVTLAKGAFDRQPDPEPVFAF